MGISVHKRRPSNMIPHLARQKCENYDLKMHFQRFALMGKNKITYQSQNTPNGAVVQKIQIVPLHVEKTADEHKQKQEGRWTSIIGWPDDSNLQYENKPSMFRSKNKISPCTYWQIGTILDPFGNGFSVETHPKIQLILNRITKKSKPFYVPANIHRISLLARTLGRKMDDHRCRIDAQLKRECR